MHRLPIFECGGRPRATPRLVARRMPARKRTAPAYNGQRAARVTVAAIGFGLIRAWSLRSKLD